MLVRSRYDCAVWSGSFTPGRANQLLARSTRSAPGSPPEPFRNFPLDGRPNDSTRNLLQASSVCRRWRHVIATHVIKHAAYFSSSEACDQLPSAYSQSPVGVQSFMSASTDAPGIIMTEQKASGSFCQIGSQDETSVSRWPLWFTAESVVCVLQGGVIPFDLGTKGVLTLE
jgi:hypothetical protein